MIVVLNTQILDAHANAQNARSIGQMDQKLDSTCKEMYGEIETNYTKDIDNSRHQSTDKRRDVIEVHPS